jgi:hypothetical protein
MRDMFVVLCARLGWPSLAGVLLVHAGLGVLARSPRAALAEASNEEVALRRPAAYTLGSHRGHRRNGDSGPGAQEQQMRSSGCDLPA